MIFSGSTKINDVRSGSATVCGALQTASQALFWGFGNTTVSRILSGSIALYKFGPGVVTLSGTNTYSNGTFLYEGTLTLNNSSAIGTSGNITFAGGGLRFLSGITRDISSRIKNSTAPIDLTIDATASQTWTSSIDSTNIAGLTKRGLGNLVFSAAQNIQGSLVCREGNVYFQQPSAFSDVQLIYGVGGAQLASTNKANGFGTGTILFQLSSGSGFPDSVTFDSAGVAAGPMVITNPVVADLTKGRGQIVFYGTKGAVLSGSVTLNGNGNTSTANTTTSTTNSNQLTFASVPVVWAVGTIVTGTGIPYGTEITNIAGNVVTCSNLMSVASGTTVSQGSGDFVITNNQTNNSLLTVSSAITGANLFGAVSLRGGNVGNDGVFNGYLNAPQGGLAHNGVNWYTVFSNANNNYSRLNVQNLATNAGFRFGDNNAIPASAVLQWSSFSGSSIDLNGKNATCSGLSGSSGATNLINTLTNSAVTPSTLTLANLAITRSFFGTTTGQINLILNSPARLQQLYGSNNHTGTNQVITGTLAVQSTAGGALSKLTVAALQSSSISATFSSTPTSTEVFKLFNGSTVNTYPSVSLTGAPGLTGYYNSSTSTIGFVPAATSVTTGFVTAQINALTVPVSANPNSSQAGSAASVSVEYGSTPSLGLTSTPVNIGTGTVSILSTHQLSGLTANTLYYYRAKVSNVLWTVNSATASISTLNSDPLIGSVSFVQTFDALTVGSTPATISSQKAGNTATIAQSSTIANRWSIASSPSISGNSLKSPTLTNDSCLLNVSLSGQFTFEASLFTNISFANAGYPLFYCYASGNDGFLIAADSNTFYFSLGLNGSAGQFTYTGISLNTWYDFAVTRDASNVVRFFLNGQLIGSGTWVGTINTCVLPSCGITRDMYLDELRTTNACRYISNYTPSHPFPTQ